MTVSIIMPCYNGEDFVGEAIASALAQTYRDIEIVVVDDASTDRSTDIVKGFAERDNRVKPLLLSQNGGAASARNQGIAVASGEWVTLLDADDLYKVDRIEQLLHVAVATGAEVVVDRQYVRDFSMAGCNDFLSFDFLAGTKPVPISPELYFSESAAFHREPSIGYMKPMFRRRYLIDGGLGFNIKYKVGEDLALYDECICRGARFVGTPYAGYIYRRRPTSLSRDDSPTAALRPLVTMCDELLDRHGATLSSKVKGLIEKRKKILERYVALLDLAAASRQRAWRRCSHIVANHPDIALLSPILIRKWSARLARRLKARKQDHVQVIAKAAG
jgi:glycosyltransferase involved in cell wall biosynthesis